MNKIMVIISALSLSACSTWQERADADRAAYYQRLADEANQPGYEYKQATEKPEESMFSYGACLLEHSYFFNDRIARYICNRR